MRSIVILTLLVAFSTPTYACSCFGPQTFCGTLNPQPPEFPNPAWWMPDAIILGVKVGQAAHGMDVQVVQTLQGQPQPEEIIRVWGDCGLLCRMYPDTWSVGDTVIWALRYTDLMGNGLCGNNLEQEGEYMISICGTYYLDYANGMVTGAIADEVTALPYPDFVQYISTCGATTLPEAPIAPEVLVTIDNGMLQVQYNVVSHGYLEHRLHDLQGRIISEGRTHADRASIPIGGLATGIHILQVSDGRHSRTLRVLIP